MVKNHLKRLAIPKTWAIGRKKGVKFITRPNPGKQFLYSMSINFVLKGLLGLVRTTKETKYLLRNSVVLVNGKKVRNHRFPVGLFDVILIGELENAYRLVLNTKGKLTTIVIDKNEALVKLVKITGKTLLKKGKVQLNFNDGSNIIVDKDDYSVNDVLVLKRPKNEIQHKIKLENGAMIYLISGKHIGQFATVEDIKKDELFFKMGDNKFKTLKDYAFAVGKDKQVIKLND